MEQASRSMKERLQMSPSVLRMMRLTRNGGWVLASSSQLWSGYTSSPRLQNSDLERQRQEWAGQEAGLLRGGAQEAEARVIRCRAWLMVDTRLNTEATRLTPRLSRMLQVLMGKTQAGVETE